MPQPPVHPFGSSQVRTPPEQAGGVHMRYGVGVEVTSAKVGNNPRSAGNSARAWEYFLHAVSLFGCLKFGFLFVIIITG